jgi:hypothetical protein
MLTSFLILGFIKSFLTKYRMERQRIVDFLVAAGIQNVAAGTYADRLIDEDVKTVEELKALKEEDLKDPKIGMKIGERSRLRPHLVIGITNSSLVLHQWHI